MQWIKNFKMVILKLACLKSINICTKLSRNDDYFMKFINLVCTVQLGGNIIV